MLSYREIVSILISKPRHLILLMALALPILVFSEGLELYMGEEHTFSMKGIELSGTITYYWSVDGEEEPINEPEITLSWDDPGEYNVEAQYSVNGCMSPLSTVTVVVLDKLPEIIPDKFFTPDGDGINDYWHIKNIEYYPNAQIEIYDRYHKLLLKTIGEEFIHNNGWDGIYNGHQVPSTDYWYYIRNILPNKPKSGHFILKRGNK